MRRVLEWSQVAVLVTLLIPAGCVRRDTEVEQLYSRCEVHLEELVRPMTDVAALTAPAHPEDACQLFLYDIDDDSDEPAYQVEESAWQLRCVEELDDQGEVLGLYDCKLVVDHVLIDRYDDGVLLCAQGAEGRCAALADLPGTRTVCRAGGSTAIEFGAGEARNTAEPLTGAVLAVETFERDDLVAVAWMGSDEEAAWPHVTWLALPSVEAAEESPLEVVGMEVDVCDACADHVDSPTDGAPAHAYVGFQTASRNESVLLAGPCGSRRILEVSRDGGCQPHEIVPPGSRHTPEIALGVMETTEGWVAIWTDGLGVYTTPLVEVEGQLVAGEPRLLHQTLETQSREDAAAICIVPVPRDPMCVISWTEVTRFGSAANPAIGRERSLHFDFFASDEMLGLLQSDISPGRAIDVGYGVRPSLVLQEDILTNHLTGVLVSRHRDNGLIARRWMTQTIGTEHSELVVRMLPRFEQLSAADEISDFSIYWTSNDTFGVVWVERTRSEPYRLGLAVLGTRLDEESLRTTRVDVTGLAALDLPSGAGEDYPRPLLMRGEDRGGRGLLFFAAQNGAGESCRTRFVMLDMSTFAPFVESSDWPEVLEATILGEREVPTPGACEPGCTGEVAPVIGGEFVVGLPSVSGVAVWKVEFVAEGEPLAAELVASSPDGTRPGCHLTIQGEPTGRLFNLFHDFLGSQGTAPSLGSVYLEVRDDGSWEAERLPVMVDGAEPRWISTPRSPITVGSGSYVLWAVHPFGRWAQRDFVVGRFDKHTDHYELSTADLDYRQVIDSRVAVSSGVPMPCDAQGAAVGDNLCATVAYSRPDISGFRDLEGYRRIERLTPIVESHVVPLSAESSSIDCATCGPVELLAGQVWRGLPTDLVPWSDDERGREPVAAFSSASPLSWEAGEATGYRFLLRDVPNPFEPGETIRRWESKDLDPSWIFGEEHQDVSVSYLRLGTRAGRSIGALWPSLTLIEEGAEEYEVVMSFSLLDGDLVPIAGGERLPLFDGGEPVEFRVEDFSSLDRSFIANDVRFLMAEHLGGAVGAVADERFVAAWMDRRFGEQELSSFTLHATVINCETEDVGQR